MSEIHLTSQSVPDTLRAVLAEIDDRLAIVQADSQNHAHRYAETGKRKHRDAFGKAQARRWVLMDVRDVVNTRLRTSIGSRIDNLSTVEAA